MPESGEWFSPRTRPEMLTSDDPPIQDDKPARVQIMPGPATAVGRATAPLRRVIELVPAIGRRVVRIDGEPSRWQLAGMWTAGSAIVAGTGLVVTAVLGGAPPALTQPFERLSVLPGIVGEQSQQPDRASSADTTDADGKPVPGQDGQRASDRSRSDAGDAYPRGSSAGVVYPEDLVPGRPVVPQVPSAGGTSAGGAGVPSGSSAGTPVTPGGGTTGPGPTTAPADPPPAPDPTPTGPPPVTGPTQEPTDPPTQPPTDPPTQDPTTPPIEPTPNPTPDPTPADPTPADPTPEPESSPDSSPDQSVDSPSTPPPTTTP